MRNLTGRTADGVTGVRPHDTGELMHNLAEPPDSGATLAGMESDPAREWPGVKVRRLQFGVGPCDLNKRG
ncbi:hypothetical protein BH23ACT3_BH23ACT3_13230 [soil metagenome]